MPALTPIPTTNRMKSTVVVQLGVPGGSMPPAWNSPPGTKEWIHTTASNNNCPAVSV